MLQRKKYIVTRSFVLLLLSMFMSMPFKLHAKGEEEREKFDAGKKIIGHVVDSYEWHIATIGEKNISIYLPVILFYEGEFFIFSSKRFQHGYSSYKGFKIESEGMKKGKIVKVKEDGVTTDTEASFLLDLSITKTAVGIFVTIIIIIFVFLKVAKLYKINQGKSPKGLQSFLEPIIIFIRDEVSKPTIGEKHYLRFMPFLLTIFFFIFFANLIGLVPFFPGGANITGNISVTATLAIISFITMLLSGNKNFYKHVFNTPGVPWYMKVPIPIMPAVELLGLLTKPFVLMVRLFANMLSGHIIALGFISLIFVLAETGAIMGLMISPVSVVFYIFIILLKMLVSFIQAYVFTLLSAIYFGMAVEEHHHEEHHEEAHKH